MTEPTASSPLAGLDPELVRALELSEAIAYNRDAYEGAAAIDDNRLGARWAEIGGGIASTLTTLDFGFFNRMVGLGIARPATEDDVDAIAAFYADLGQSTSVIQLAPTAQPAELFGWAEVRGYKPGGRWVKLWHDLETLPEATSPFRIERIGPDRVRDFGHILCQAFELPDELWPIAGVVGRDGWTCYLAFDGDLPVSTAAVYVHDEWAWLGYGATIESHRGRGGQSAMFAERLRDAKAAGARWAITETGAETPEEPVNHSYRNMLRSGFHLAYERRNYVRVTGS